MTRRIYWTVSLLLLMLPGIVGALGLGRISVDSFLNEPLDARIELVALRGVEIEDLRVTLADAQSFEKAGLERPFILSGLRFRVVGEPGRQGYIRVTSRDSIKEPFLDFLIALEWQGNRIMRQFTILLDPPVVRPVARARGFVPQKAAEPTVAVRAAGVGEDRQMRQYGPVRRSETLWVIARKMRPDQETTVEQMMMALLRANPDAFRYGNVNFLKQGAVLDVPDRGEVQSLSPKQARRLFREQTRAWKLLRKGEAAIVPKTAPAPVTPAAPLDLAAQPENIAPIQRQGTPGSRVSTEQPSAKAAGNGDAANLRVIESDPEWSDGQGPLAEEQGAENKRYPVREQETLKEAIADSRQNVEAVKEINRNLQELRSVLEGKIDSLRESLEQRDRIIADLQQRLERVTAGPDRGTEREGSSQRPARKTAGGIATESVITAAPEAAAEGSRGQMLEQGLVSVLDWARGYWLSLVLGLVVLLLILLLIFSLRRRHRNNKLALAGDAVFGSYVDLEEDLENRSAAASNRMGDETLQRDDDGEDYFIEPGADVASSLTEADIYLAYRRYSQAEALIREAINANPESMVLKAKLLEIYAFRKDKRHFVPYMEEVYQSMAAEAPEIWAKVVAMGGKLVPEHPLIDAAGMSDLSDSGLAGSEGEMDLEAEIQLLDMELGDKEDGKRHR